MQTYCHLDRLPIMTACEVDDFEKVKFLLKEHKKVKWPVELFIDDNGDTVLTIASKFSSLDIFEYLIENTDLNVFQPGYLGRNCFHWACSEGKLDIVKFLINKYDGIDKTRDSKGQTGFILAAVYSSIELIELLIEHQKTKTHGKFDFIEFLETETGFLNRNALMFSVVGVNYKVLKFLEEKITNSTTHFERIQNLWTAVDSKGCNIGIGSAVLRYDS